MTTMNRLAALERRQATLPRKAEPAPLPAWIVPLIAQANRDGIAPADAVAAWLRLTRHELRTALERRAA
jgi:hypothetical protein